MSSLRITLSSDYVFGLLAPHPTLPWEKRLSATSKAKIFFALSTGCAKHILDLLSSAKGRSDQ